VSEEKWCPTQAGKYTAYAPQWLDGEEWKRIPTERAVRGVPQPALCGGINHELGLFGHAQAMALAWAFAALYAAEGRTIDVRAQPYEIVYDLKARAIDEAERGDFTV
jgi:hypothetical protein